MDFVMGLPKTQAGFDAIWVIIDRLTKSAHFLPIRATYPLEKVSPALCPRDSKTECCIINHNLR